MLINVYPFTTFVSVFQSADMLTCLHNNMQAREFEVQTRCPWVQILNALVNNAETLQNITTEYIYNTTLNQ